MIRHLLAAVLAGVVLWYLTTRLSTYNVYQVGEIASYIVVLAGLSLLTGANGQISLGHGGFMAVGAYTLGLLMTHTSTNFILELVAAAGVAAAAGVLIGLPATRLKGPYLAGMTLLFALAVPSIADKWPATFGGDQGLTVSAPTAPGTLGQEEWLAWIQILGALIVLVLLANLLWSRYGRSFRAVRDDEIAASLAGIHVARTKVLAFAIERGVRRARRRTVRALDGDREHRCVPRDAVDPTAGGNGARRHRDPDRHGMGRDPPRVPAPVVDVVVVGLQSRQRSECVSRHDHLRAGAHRGHARGAQRDPGRAAVVVGAPSTPRPRRPRSCRAGPGVSR